MVIDAHTHLLPPSFPARLTELRRRDRTMAALFARDGAKMATADDLIAAMNAAGVDAAVAAGYGWTNPDLARESNDYILESAARFPGRILPFCSVNPAWGADAAAELERCAAAGAVGLGELHFSSQGVRVPDGEG
ncbi:MAG: amidohydrolase family protein, partial [Dehalococcoidia bacterium]|nr:amidohydrolase family protein [Dehalococcoidia bacterium]